MPWIGFLLGLGVAAGVVEAAWEGALVDGPSDVWGLYLSPLLVLVIGWLVGLLLTRTVGILANVAGLGFFVAALLAPFRGEWFVAPALLLGAAAFLLVANGQRYRLDLLEGRRPWD
jgi:hypothetical protein